MGEKIVVGIPTNQGLRKDKTAFNIDNDSFPTLINAYQWRGRVKRKRGTSLLNRLQRYFNSTSTAYSSTATIALSGGAANLLTGFSLQSGGSIIPGTVTINNVTVAQSYTDPAMDGNLVGSLGGTGTINYATGAIVITGGAGNSINATFRYYPGLPVLGLEELNLTSSQFPGNLGFDTTYSYNITGSVPYNVYDVSFYKNPAVDGTNYPGYTPKSTLTPTTWNGQNYQQFWTVNYENALWATNGIKSATDLSSIGMQFKVITTVDNITGGPPAFADLTIASHGLVVGDFVFINEVLTTTGINFQTGYVTAVVNANKVTVEFPFATIATNGSGGIAQYLTNRSDTTKDCLRWYDGDPTNGSATAPVLNGTKGWVNFMPPLSQSNFQIGDAPAKQWYLVGARLIVPFKDRLLFIGPVIQTSSANSQIYLQDTVIYSQNGTPFYTASFTGNVDAATTVFNPILTPTLLPSSSLHNSTAPSYFSDQTGFGGFISAGFSQPITTASPNEDVVILGFSSRQTRLVYTGNDIVPFNFFVINSELGSGSTFSQINLDRGVMTIGDHGIIETSQISSQRIDLQIPDNVFEFQLANNGPERITAARDFINEWVYFTYLSNTSTATFPNQTLQYNYRDQSWAVFNESYTTYGTFREVTGKTWANIGLDYPTWGVWNDPWNAGASTLLQAKVIAGNQQGFIVIRDDGTDESPSLFITSFSGNTVTSANHGLNNGDFITISGCIGTIASTVNGIVWKVSQATQNTFVAVNNNLVISGNYSGNGTITRFYKPQIQTKQFPLAWSMGRKTRIGFQQYLLTTTASGQIELQIFLSQDSANAYNAGPIVPDVESENDGLIYSDVLYTCPESTNLGLTPANTNLQMLTASTQQQTWHRVNTSLIGDTVQLGFTLNEDQMFDPDQYLQTAEIELHGFIIDVQPSMVLA